MTLTLDPHPAMIIATELVTVLEGQSLDELVGPLQVNLVAVPELELIELQSQSQILIAPRGLDSQPSSRRSTNEQPSVDIAIRTNCPATRVDRVQTFLSFAWTLRRFLLARKQVAGFTLMNVVSNPIYDVDRLRTLNELLINQTFQFTAIMEHD